MYYSGSQADAYSYATLLYYGLFVLAIALLIAALVAFIITKSKKNSKKALRLMIILLCLALVVGVVSIVQPRPRCCGEGYTYTPSALVI